MIKQRSNYNRKKNQNVLNYYTVFMMKTALLKKKKKLIDIKKVCEKGI